MRSELGVGETLPPIFNMKTLIGVNTLTSIDNSVYLTHCQFWYRLGKEFPDEKFIFYAPHRLSIDNMRNNAAKVALEQECDYLMFIDDDMILDPNTFSSLLHADADIAMALTYIRTPPFAPMFFQQFEQNGRRYLKLFPNEFNSFKDANGYINVDAVGFACVLIDCNLLKRLSPPWFVTLPGITEDVYFCMRCRDELRDVTIKVDTNVPTGHVMDPQVVTSSTVEKLREFYEVKDQEVNLDRGTDYAEKIEALFR